MLVLMTIVALADFVGAPLVAVDELCDVADVVLVSAPCDDPRSVLVADVDETMNLLRSAVAAQPTASAVLVGLLRLTSSLPVPEALVAESLAYSLLLAGRDFAEWRAAHLRRHSVPEFAPPVRLERHENVLTVALSRPHRHNAFNAEMRDALVEALEVARHDPDLRVDLRGDGTSFCSGGDLDEFGTAKDLGQAHLVRLQQSVGLRLHVLAARTTAHLHGACIGAGIELPAFAGHVVAAPSTRIQLPELMMGLIPGAGGTVSVTKRVGRWRTAYLALSGVVLDADTAQRWGLVDVLS
jgi:hypothetical protein